ncbi:MAG: amidase [Anaerolineae bacterium]|nr:amidase [Anaerolineae bacterium]
MNKPDYDLKSIKMPYFSGFLLQLFVFMIESPLSKLVIPSLLDSAGVTAFRSLEYDDPPVVHPLAYVGELNSNMTQSLKGASLQYSREVEKEKPGFAFRKYSDYTHAYTEGRFTPLEIATRVIELIERSQRHVPALNAIIASQADDLRQQAEGATLRYREGNTLGPLDGVPIAIKDEFDLCPYPTMVGTKFLGRNPASADATSVARLRAAGALLIGKANMHEVGIGVTGFNAHYGTARNPYNVNHYTGGSSSGPAASVAAGLCPAALGADGGGSIRIPAAFCGLVGLKPTFGRVSEYGAAPLTWSMAHVGPLGASTGDAAMMYATIAGPDPMDKMSWHQPLPQVHGWETGDIEGLKLGVFWPWFRHAAPELVKTCKDMLDKFENLGARVHEVSIPDLEAARVAHTVIIAGEIAQSLERYYKQHRTDYSFEVRTNLALARSFTASDFIMAQRVRARMIAHFDKVFKQVDAVVTPATGLAAPRIPDGALPYGDSDLTSLIEIMRFATVPNLTGMPAISFPVGYTVEGLPIGMQAIARPWDEITLLRLSKAAELSMLKRKPSLHYDVLEA